MTVFALLTILVPGHISSSDFEDTDHRPPTDEERRYLREVSDTIPWSAYALCLFVCIQWGASSGASTVVSNFVQFPLPKGGNGTGATPRGTQQTPGALGFGLRKTNALFVSIRFLSPFLKLFGAWLADTKIGRFRVLALATGISCLYMVLFVVSAIPSILRAGNSVAPFMLGYCLKSIFAIRKFRSLLLDKVADVLNSALRTSRQSHHNGPVHCAARLRENASQQSTSHRESSSDTLTNAVAVLWSGQYWPISRHWYHLGREEDRLLAIIHRTMCHNVLAPVDSSCDLSSRNQGQT